MADDKANITHSPSNKRKLSNIENPKNFELENNEDTNDLLSHKIQKTTSTGFQFNNLKGNSGSKFFYFSGSFSSSGGGSDGENTPPKPLINNYQAVAVPLEDVPKYSPKVEDKQTNLFRGDSLENDLSCGVFEAMGKRKAMEDRHEVVPFVHPPESTQTPKVDSPKEDKIHESHAFFAIYDGHGGSAAADYVQAHLHKEIASHPDFVTDPEKAIREGMKQVEDGFTQMVLKQNMDGLTGTTVLVALILGNILYVANVGDSGLILYRKGNILRLTNAHTPKAASEKARVEKSGGVIYNQRLGHPTWNAKLINIAVSRAFGDIYFKSNQFTSGKSSGLIAEPEIVKVSLTIDDEFILMGSDGFWDVITPREASDYVLANPTKEPSQICKELTEYALKKSAIDNTTVLLIRLQANHNHGVGPQVVNHSKYSSEQNKTGK